MSLTTLRERALRRKRSVLTASLEGWLEATAGRESRSDAAFEIHYSQTREVDHLMGGLCQVLEKVLNEAALKKTILQRGCSIEETLLASCQVWEFFRTKLAQRLDAVWKPFLRIADELAWSCYKPVRSIALGDSPLCKAPPLVYLNSGWSPFTVRRDTEYQLEAVPRAFMRDPDFKKALSRLPFPVIAVPWYQTAYLPDAVAICHEVGHSVEADFGLTTQIDAAITAAIDDEQSRADWLRRGAELFADYYGCLSVGPAFAWALANILLADPATIAVQSDSRYPSSYSRMVFNATILRKLEFGPEADNFEIAWRETYPGATAGAEEASEIERIARHLVGTDAINQPPGITVSNTPLRNALCFSRLQQDEVYDEVKALNEGGEAASGDIRVLFASAVFAAAHPTSTAHAPLVAAMHRACVDERRNQEATLSRTIAQQRADHLQETGAAIAAELLGVPATGSDIH